MRDIIYLKVKMIKPNAKNVKLKSVNPATNIKEYVINVKRKIKDKLSRMNFMNV